MQNDDLLIEISQRLQDDYQFKPTQDGKHTAYALHNIS